MEEKPAPTEATAQSIEVPSELSKDVTNMAMLAHLLGALTGFVGPLIMWLVKKDDHEFVEDQSKEALNFQLTLLIWHVAAAAIVFASCGFIFFAPLLPVVLQLVFGIMGATTASKGEAYHYPMTIQFVK